MRIEREKNKIRIFLNEHRSSHEQYFEKEISNSRIAQLSKKIIQISNEVDCNGRIDANKYEDFIGHSMRLYDHIFPSEIKTWLSTKETTVPLVLTIDESLASIPWELLHDGTEMLCLKFNLSRFILTNKRINTNKIRMKSFPKKTIAIGYSQDNLKSVAQEVKSVKEILEKEEVRIDLETNCRNSTKEYVYNAMRRYDMVHFAGHCTKNGWKLKDGIFSAKDIKELTSPTQSMPLFVFSNACNSGQILSGNKSEKDVFNFALSFIIAGIQTYIGTVWKITDNESKCFAELFYKNMFCERKMFTLSEDVIMPDIGVVEKAGTDVMLGIEAGDALRLARKQFIEQFGEKTLAWASYLLYGDSTFSCSMPEAYAYPSQKSPKTIVIDC